MSTHEFAGVRGTGRQGLPVTRPVCGPPHHHTPAVPGIPGGGTAAAASVTRAWEQAYRDYGRAWETAARSAKGDPVAAREMASASRAVAAAWRQISATTTLPWWALAAIESAAAAFEAQAGDYEPRENSEESS